MQDIYYSITQQIKAGSRVNLLKKSFSRHIRINRSFIETVQQVTNSADSREYQNMLDDIAGFSARTFIRQVYSSNQYIQISDSAFTELKQIYRNTWQSMKQAGDVRQVMLDSHYPALAAWTADQYERDTGCDDQEDDAVTPVLCREYSADTQRSILHLEALDLSQPVLDIGCGEKGHLVRRLADLGIQAAGFDRSVLNSDETVQYGDWFAFDFREGVWGTVISNAALSNHIIHAVRFNTPLKEQYIQLFYTVLRSLKPGGVFCYAPDMPFLEEGLEQRFYSVQKFSAAHGLYATHIIRHDPCAWIDEE